MKKRKSPLILFILLACVLTASGCSDYEANKSQTAYLEFLSARLEALDTKLLDFKKQMEGFNEESFKNEAFLGDTNAKLDQLQAECDAITNYDQPVPQGYEAIQQAMTNAAGQIGKAVATYRSALTEKSYDTMTTAGEELSAATQSLSEAGAALSAKMGESEK